MIDNISKFLIEQYPSDFATLLLGQPITVTTINPSELNVEPIRADSIILLDSPELILHTEFQTEPRPEIPFRMADYYLRLRRKFPEREIQQIVIYIKPSTSYLVKQTKYKTNVMTHKFRVIRLWEEPVETFLKSPGLLPYAVLSNAENQEEILGQVVGEIDKLTDSKEQSNLAAATSILAGLKLTEEVIRRLMGSSVMRESTMYQAILREGERDLVLKLLTRKVGSLSPQLQARIASLSIERLEALGEALLDFQSARDLESWLGQ